MTAARVSRWPVVAGIVAGVAFASVGLQSLLGAAEDTRPFAAGSWLVGLAVVHDVVLVPVVLVVGVAVKRLAPRAWRPWLAAGLVVSSTVALVAWPFVRGYGRLAGNPSLLPRNYAAGLAIILAGVWMTTIVAAMLFRRGP